MPPSISLSELSDLIKEVIELSMERTYLVHAEISQLNERGGHCYLELIEKDERSSLPKAKVRAHCWAGRYSMLRAYFEHETGRRLEAGMQILVETEVTYHALYGLSLNIVGIMPEFTLGDIARQRQLTIERLRQEGVFELNKMLDMPTLVQRVAVISSDTAAGYGDFCNQLHQNQKGYRFFTHLYPALMQGSGAAASIIAALEQIADRVELYDAVVIIRGGGATTDLACFDDYGLALHCTQFPLPIIAGIGHQRDVSVVDLVVHTSVKTPTAAAEWLIARLDTQAARLQNLQVRLRSGVERRSGRLRQQVQGWSSHVQNALFRATAREQLRLSQRRERLRSLLRQRTDRRLVRLQSLQQQFLNQWALRRSRQLASLDLKQKTVELHSPERIFNMGYSLTRLNGRPVRSAADVKAGDVLTTHLRDGQVLSRVEPAPADNK